MNPRPSKTEDSRHAILRAAIEEFAEQGEAGARTDAIARAAGVNKALIALLLRHQGSPLRRGPGTRSSPGLVELPHGAHGPGHRRRAAAAPFPRPLRPPGGGGFLHPAHGPRDDAGPGRRDRAHPEDRQDRLRARSTGPWRGPGRGHGVRGTARQEPGPVDPGADGRERLLLHLGAGLPGDRRARIPGTRRSWPGSGWPCWTSPPPCCSRIRPAAGPLAQRIHSEHPCPAPPPEVTPVNPRYRIFAILGVLLLVALGYYYVLHRPCPGPGARGHGGRQPGDRQHPGAGPDRASWRWTRART